MNQIRIIRHDASAFPPSPAQCDAGEVALVKGREAALLAASRSHLHVMAASAIQAAPTAAIALATRDITERMQMQTRSLPFAYEWNQIIQRGDIDEICAVMRDTTEQTEQLRICNPFAGLTTAHA